MAIEHVTLVECDGKACQKMGRRILVPDSKQLEDAIRVANDPRCGWNITKTGDGPEDYMCLCPDCKGK